MLPQKGALILLAPSLDEVALVELHNPPRTRRVPFGLNPLTFTRYIHTILQRASGGRVIFSSERVFMISMQLHFIACIKKSRYPLISLYQPAITYILRGRVNGWFGAQKLWRSRPHDTGPL